MALFLRMCVSGDILGFVAISTYYSSGIWFAMAKR